MARVSVVIMEGGHQSYRLARLPTLEGRLESVPPFSLQLDNDVVIDMVVSGVMQVERPLGTLSIRLS